MQWTWGLCCIRFTSFWEQCCINPLKKIKKIVSWFAPFRQTRKSLPQNKVDFLPVESRSCFISCLCKRATSLLCWFEGYAVTPVPTRPLLSQLFSGHRCALFPSFFFFFFLDLFLPSLVSRPGPLSLLSVLIDSAGGRAPFMFSLGVEEGFILSFCVFPINFCLLSCQSTWLLWVFVSLRTERWFSKILPEIKDGILSLSFWECRYVNTLDEFLTGDFFMLSNPAEPPGPADSICCAVGHSFYQCHHPRNTLQAHIIVAQMCRNSMTCRWRHIKKKIAANSL